MGGSSADMQRCCYPVNYPQLLSSWCEGELDMMEDGIRLLSECSENLRGRMEFPIKSFRSEHYEGSVKQSGKEANVYLVSELKRRKTRKSDAPGSPTAQAAC